MTEDEEKPLTEEDITTPFGTLRVRDVLSAKRLLKKKNKDFFMGVLAIMRVKKAPKEDMELIASMYESIKVFPDECFQLEEKEVKEEKQ